MAEGRGIGTGETVGEEERELEPAHTYMHTNKTEPCTKVKQARPGGQDRERNMDCERESDGVRRTHNAPFCPIVNIGTGVDDAEYTNGTDVMANAEDDDVEKEADGEWGDEE